MVPAYVNDRAYLVLGNRLITAGGSSVLIFDYPSGANPIKTISIPGSDARGVTVSVAPPR